MHTEKKKNFNTGIERATTTSTAEPNRIAKVNRLLLRTHATRSLRQFSHSLARYVPPPRRRVSSVCFLFIRA